MKYRSAKIIASLFAAALLHISPAHAANTAPAAYASLPWLSGMAQFIVGSTINIQSASSWNSSGSLVAPRGKPRDAAVIALDPKDAARLGFETEAPNLYLLYDNLPIEESKRGYMPFNPSILPFLSQRLLIVLCKLSPDNYSFYQRRLAEFQSRLESAVEVGRSLIHDAPVLDLSGAVGPWIRAASAKAVRPPDELWYAWSGNIRIAELALAVKEAENNGWHILTDAWTPQQIRAHTISSKRLVSISPPEADYDFFNYLHDIYLKFWTVSSAK
ncbi:MAG: hypothetical protein LBB28_05335 [Synergistaceae bacterium]|nr:hypothetical protein [Synergistaceae bacterium]